MTFVLTSFYTHGTVQQDQVSEMNDLSQVVTSRSLGKPKRQTFEEHSFEDYSSASGLSDTILDWSNDSNGKNFTKEHSHENLKNSTNVRTTKSHS